jgi:mRNA interferase MazF
VKPGEVVLIRFPFAELATTKKRPALVLARTTRSPRNRLVTLAMITSQVEALRLLGDVVLVDWKAAGLLHPSLLRMAKSRRSTNTWWTRASAGSPNAI